MSLLEQELTFFNPTKLKNHTGGVGTEFDRMNSPFLSPIHGQKLHQWLEHI